MNNLAVKPYIISGIEWAIDREFHYGVENAKYIEALINDVKYLPIKNGEIKFEDDRWDLRPYYTMKKTNDLVFSFKIVPKCYIINAKFFVLLSLLNSDNKPATINRRFQDIKAFLNYLHLKDIKSLEVILPSTIKEYMESKNELSDDTKSMIYIALYDFFSFIKANYTNHLLFDLSIFDEKETLLARIKATKEKHKTPDIPKLYFNKLLSLLIKSMRNKELEYKYRAISCIYIILSQTGLRIGEILSLEVDALDSIKLKNLDTIAYFLKYNTFKPAGKDEEYIPGDIFANELTKEAFEILVELRKGQKNGEGNNFIYLPDTKILPATNKTSNCHFYSFLAEFADFAQGNVSPYKELTVVKNNGKPVFAPTTKQFRVRVCTELYERNVPLLYIKKYMSHLSDEMIGYYSRPKTQKQEDAEYSNKLLKDLVQNEVSLLGNDSKQINANIDSFIKENNLTVEDDIDSIIKSLNGQFVIRAKRGGVCVKTSIRECARDARTNEMFCAYDICPNLFRLYYMADVSYEDFKLTQKTFQSNKENGFKLQASKELNKLHDLCRRRLKPELEDLKKRVQTKGMQEILTNYPNLSDIILNYDGIMEEVNLWMKVKY